MKSLLDNLGIILVLLGVVVFVAYSFMSYPSNLWLVLGLALEILGVFAQVIFNRRIR